MPGPFPLARLQARKSSTGDTPPPVKLSARVKTIIKANRGRLFFQLCLYFVVLSLLPLLLVGYLNYLYAASGILTDKEENLEALVSRQADGISTYFQGMKDVARLLATSPAVREIFTTLGNVTPTTYNTYANRPEYRAAGLMWQSRFGDFFSDLKVTQIYLVNTQGLVIFSSGRYGGVLYSLDEPPGNGWAMARLYHQVLEARTVTVSPMTDDSPSGDTSMYIGAPVVTADNNSSLAGVLILLLDNDHLQEILNNDIGLGNTGESLVLTRRDDKYLLLNQPRYKSNSIMAPIVPFKELPAFSNGPPSAGQTPVALAVDYRDHSVLASWTYLPALGWTLIQKIDREEMLEPIASLRRFNIYVGGATLGVVVLAAAFLTRGITRPVVRLTRVAERIAHGDLSETVDINARNEIGLLAQAVCTMARSLKSLVRRVQDSAAMICTNTAQMAATAKQQSEVSHATGSTAVEVAAAAKQISATSLELTRTMEEVNSVAQDTAQRAEYGLDCLSSIRATMKELDQARASVASHFQLIAQKAQAIGNITVTMTKVADQTNLLSLNAAIEARKAGEYGRGFKVVAKEIQRLADQTGVATLDIERTIDEMLKAVGGGVDGMRDFAAKASAALERVQAVSTQLTGVIQQVQGLPPRFEMVLQGMHSQSQGAQQINEAISQMSETAQQTATAIHEAQLLLEQLRDTTRSLQGEVSLFKV